jgi:hypothetical protein
VTPLKLVKHPYRKVVCLSGHPSLYRHGATVQTPLPGVARLSRVGRSTTEGES